MALDDVQQRVLTAALAMQRQSWEQGVLGHALLDLGEHRLAALLAHDAVTRQTPSGKLGEIDDAGVVNGAANGEAVLALGPAGAPALERQLAWLDRGAPRADDGTLFHLEGSREVWVDTVYMVVPLLVRTGRLEAAARQLAGHRRRLFDERARLYAHQWDETSGRLVRAAHWGSGNGWVAAGLARALRHLRRHGTAAAPAEAGRFRRVAADHARDVIDACLEHRASSGLFHDVVDDAATFEEVTLALMLAYAVRTGVDDGWLARRHAETGRSLLETAYRHVDGAGYLTPACGAPRFDRPGTSTESQAFFLLATAAGRTVR